MPEKPRRPVVAGDTERAYARHRTASPALGVSIPVEIDPELTPPPQAPPLEGTLEDQVASLFAAAQEQAEAMQRVWAARNVADQVLTIGNTVAEMSALMREFMMPAVKMLLGRVDVIERANEANRGKSDRFWDHEWPTAMKTLDSIGQHMGRIEKDVDRVERNLDAYMKRTDEQTLSLRAQVVELKSEDDKQEGRIRALEDFVLTVKAKVAIVSALVGGGGAGAAYVIQKLLGG